MSSIVIYNIIIVVKSIIHRNYLRVKDSSREICKERKKNSPNNSWSRPDEKLHINTETKELPTRSSFRVLEGLSCFDSINKRIRPPRSGGVLGTSTSPQVFKTKRVWKLRAPKRSRRAQENLEQNDSSILTCIVVQAFIDEKPENKSLALAAAAAKSKKKNHESKRKGECTSTRERKGVL
ncbi:unnamed protein product [Rhizophagus irregularis]|uniref:Uncharacterized protein n=1 Tax=Rhizophagus irregularis TaxID=588596 RepID=A0A915ZZ46_9GLOM|nr:unnamed protein product [Rhizophagus irregularis]